MPPEIGVTSILKSPVWMTVPSGVPIARATESGMLWFTWINSIVKHPSRKEAPTFFVKICVLYSRSCSSSFSSIKAAVSGSV